jgi:hypothetical protein
VRLAERFADSLASVRRIRMPDSVQAKTEQRVKLSLRGSEPLPRSTRDDRSVESINARRRHVDPASLVARFEPSALDSHSHCVASAAELQAALDSLDYEDQAA